MSFAEKFAARAKARRGRPRRAVATIPVCVRIDPALYDTYCKRAIVERVSVQSVLHRTLLVGAPPAQTTPRR